MKQIFKERKTVGQVVKAWVGQDWESYRTKVYRATVFINASVEAHFDKDTRTLVIDFRASEHDEYAVFEPRTQRIFETQETHAEAIRSVICHADNWYCDITNATPLSEVRSDEELLEAHAETV